MAHLDIICEEAGRGSSSGNLSPTRPNTCAPWIEMSMWFQPVPSCKLLGQQKSSTHTWQGQQLVALFWKAALIAEASSFFVQNEPSQRPSSFLQTPATWPTDPSQLLVFRRAGAVSRLSADADALPAHPYSSPRAYHPPSCGVQCICASWTSLASVMLSGTLLSLISDLSSCFILLTYIEIVLKSLGPPLPTSPFLFCPLLKGGGRC